MRLETKQNEAWMAAIKPEGLKKVPFILCHRAE